LPIATAPVVVETVTLAAGSSVAGVLTESKAVALKTMVILNVEIVLLPILSRIISTFTVLPGDPVSSLAFMQSEEVPQVSMAGWTTMDFAEEVIEL